MTQAASNGSCVTVWTPRSPACSCTVPPDAEGVARARSATEAFLYRRLQTLPDTQGRFRLNAALPIAFDGCGSLEVDLFCQDARVAVELDGAQHLGDPAAYRRDRRKNQLLQENGYLVLRFLAEDVGKDLSLVLDSILRVLNHRGAAASVGSIVHATCGFAKRRCTGKSLTKGTSSMDRQELLGGQGGPLVGRSWARLQLLSRCARLR